MIRPFTNSALVCVVVFLVGISMATSYGAHAQEPQLSHDQALSLIQRMQLESPFRLTDSARAGRIRYTLTQGLDSTWQLPATPEQRVTRTDDGLQEVTVCRACGNEPPPDQETLARYLAATQWIDRDSPEVQAFANANAFGIRIRPSRVARQMNMLVKAVQRHMDGNVDFRGYDTASHALKSRSGDCTEFAVVLAAAARARGIPTRLVYGIAYASRFTGRSHVFSPHVWVQAWDGTRWTSYDAGLGRFDSGHIAFYIDDGATNRLEDVINAIAEVRIANAVEVRINQSR